jgi:dTDP-glucose 4,6-dehydratase
MTIENRQIFLTGGAGFIGAALIGKLIDKNKIIVYDTFQRDSIKDMKFYKHPNLRLIQADVLNLQKLKESIKGSNIVIHLAAVAGVDSVLESPTTTMSVNMFGTHNALEASVTLEDIERFVDFSTSEVYGSYAYKLDEGGSTSMGAVGEARWTYAISKLAVEHLTHMYYKEFNLPSVSIRPFNIYGPGQVGEGAIHAFITRSLRNQDILIHGDGDQIRSWCYIDDIVEGILLCLEKKEAIGEVFNIGNPRGTITILSLAEKIIELTRSKSKLIFVPKPYTDIELRIPDIVKAKKILGYLPKVDLDEGLIKTINWYRKKMK